MTARTAPHETHRFQDMKMAAGRLRDVAELGLNIPKTRQGAQGVLLGGQQRDDGGSSTRSLKYVYIYM